MKPIICKSRKWSRRRKVRRIARQLASFGLRGFHCWRRMGYVLKKRNLTPEEVAAWR